MSLTTCRGTGACSRPALQPCLMAGDSDVLAHHAEDMGCLILLCIQVRVCLPHELLVGLLQLVIIGSPAYTCSTCMGLFKSAQLAQSKGAASPRMS